MKDINWPYPAKGENSCDDPHEIGQSYATLMQNMLPDGSVRGGIMQLNIDPIPDISWTYLYDDSDNPAVLIKSGVDLMALVGNFASVIKSNCFQSPDDTVSAERIGDSVVIITDNEQTGCFLVTRRDGAFVFESARLQRAGTENIKLGDQSDSRIITHDFPQNSYRSYTFTWIRRTDDGSATGFNECQIESESNLDVKYSAIATTDGLPIRITVSDIPTGATHVRLYRTIGTPTENIKNYEVVDAGMEFLWLADIPVAQFAYYAWDGISENRRGPDGLAVEYIDNSTDGEMAGETNKLWMIGKNQIPTGRHVKYHNNRLWVGGKDGYNPGRWYYSEPIRSDVPLKWLLTFDYITNFIDTSVDNTEYSMGCASSRGDLILFMDKNIWRLPAGDPENYAPVRIGSGLGTLHPNSICENNQNAYYLSLRGPAVVGGTEVELAKEFTISDLWPSAFTGRGRLFQTGEFPNQQHREKVFGFWYDDHWIIACGAPSTDGISSISCLMAPAGEVMGAWRVRTTINLRRFQPVSGTKCLAWDAEGRTYQFLSQEFLTDNYVNYTIDIQLSPKYITARNDMATPYFAVLQARWSDSGELRTIVKMDSGRIWGSYRYDEVRPTTPVYGHSMPVIRNGWTEQRMIVQQCFQESTIGTWVQPQIQKNFYRKFEFKGLTMRMKVMDGIMREYVSVSQEEPLTNLDAGIAVFDLQGQ